MLFSSSQLGKFIHSLNLQEFERQEGSIAEERILALVEKMVAKANSQGVSQSATELRPVLFNLRVELINDPSLREATLQQSDLTIIKWVADIIQVQSEHAELIDALVTALETYQKVVGQIKTQIPGLIQEKHKAGFEYSQIKNFVINIPEPYSDIFEGMIDSSLDLEFGLILSDLAVRGKFNLDSKTRNELIELLKSSMEKFAVNLGLLRLWEPAEEDENHWIRNIKILLSAKKSELGLELHRINSDKELQDLFSAS